MFTGHATDQNRGQVHVDNIKLYPRETRGVQRARAHLFLVPQSTRLLCTQVCFVLQVFLFFLRNSAPQFFNHCASFCIHGIGL